MNNTPNLSPEFIPGQIVFLKADPSTRGAVVTVLPGTPESRINVFVNGNIQTFYPSQLQIEVQRDDSRSFSSDEFHVYLTALQIHYEIEVRSRVIYYPSSIRKSLTSRINVWYNLRNL